MRADGSTSAEPAAMASASGSIARNFATTNQPQLADIARSTSDAAGAAIQMRNANADPHPNKDKPHAE